MRKFLSLFAVLVFCCIQAYPQTKTVTGKITDDQGQPVPFATVRIKGSTIGTSANADGVFSIKASSDQVLIISGANIVQQEFPVGDATILNLTVKRQDASMAEVVVTALGITRNRNQLAYSTQKLAGTDVNQARNNNFINTMSGKVSGLEVRQNNSMGGSTNVILRGSKSLTGNNQALFVVDGIPFDNTNNNTTDQTTGRGGIDFGNAAADINPDMIESVTILKGAAASALYGSRGSNGVILITTKKGKKGNGIGVTINSGISQSSYLKNTFPKYQKKYGAGYGDYFDAADVNGDGTDDDIVPTYDDASWGIAFDPNKMVYGWTSFDPSSPTFGKPQAWVAAANDPNYFFEKPINYNNSIFIENAGDKGSYAVGYTRNNEKGILPNSSLNKDLLNMSATYKFTDKLTGTLSANYSSIKGLGRYGTGYGLDNGSVNQMTNFRQWWQVNVDMKDLKDAYWRHQTNDTWNQHFGPSGEIQPEFWNNPYFDRYKSFETDRRDRVFGYTSLTYKPIDWLSIMGRISLDGFNELLEERKAVGTIGVPSYRRFNQDYKEFNYDLLVNGEWKVGDYGLKALLGTNTRVQKTSSVNGITNGGLAQAELYSLSNSVAAISPVEFEGTRRVEGVFGGFNIDYKNTYVIDLTLRRDKSSTLPDGNNVYYYPSISGGIVLSELFQPTWLSYSKFRVNYAEVGGDAPLYSVKDFYVGETDPNSGLIFPSFNGNAMYSVAASKRNPDLKPERTKSFEVGLEAAFLKSRVGFDVNFYSAKTVDQIVPLTVSTATGYSTKIVNSGTVRNQGIEVSLYGTPVKTKDFAWDININWTRNRNKVLALYNDVENIVLGSFQGSITLNATLNEPYGSIHGTDFIYTNGQKTVGADGNYLITPNNNVSIGNVNPDWIGGMNNKFTYKNLSLSVLIDMKHGGSVFSTDMYYALAGGLYEETAVNNDLGNPIRSSLAKGGGIIREGVTEDGKTNTKRVSLSDEDLGIGGSYGQYDSYVSAPDKRFVYDASYVKLREVAVTYSLPAKLFQKIFIKGIDVSLLGRNLAILHKNLPYADPEDGFSSGNLQGIQTGSYPAVRSVGFNVRVKF